MEKQKYKAAFSTKNYYLKPNVEKYVEENDGHIVDFDYVTAVLHYICYEIPSNIKGDGYQPYTFEYNNDNFAIIKPNILKNYKNKVSQDGLVKLVLKVEFELTQVEYHNLYNYNKDQGIACYITLLHEWDGEQYFLPCSFENSSPSILEFTNN